jgi:hypothetical protein
MAEAAEAGDANLVAGPDAEFPERRVCGDAGAKQRRSAADVETVRKLQDEFLAGDNMIGIAAWVIESSRRSLLL